MTERVVIADDGRVIEPSISSSTLDSVVMERFGMLRLRLGVGRQTIEVTFPKVSKFYGADMTLQNVLLGISFFYNSGNWDVGLEQLLGRIPDKIVNEKEVLSSLCEGCRSIMVIWASNDLFIVAFGSWSPDDASWKLF